MLREKNGITLIALTVTIIVLLILAGITIAGGNEAIKSSKSNKLLAELDMVQHACLERYSEYKLTNNSSLLIGTPVDFSTVQSAAAEMGVTFLKSADNYYRLTSSDLESLGINGCEDTYIVNYEVGEVLNISRKTTSDNQSLYASTNANSTSVTTEGYIQSGLILHYDGINNTGNGHSSSATSWKDLSGNGNDGAVHGGTWSDNYINLDGTDDYIEKNGITGTNTFTVELIAKDAGTVDANYGSLFMINPWSGTSTDSSIQVFIDRRTDSTRKPIGRIFVPKTSEDTYREISCSGYYQGSSYVISKSNSIIKFYDQGSVLGTNTQQDFIDRLNFNTINFQIGRWYGNAKFVMEKVYAFRIYNRALSDAEIKQNYNVDKARFGF